MYSNKASLKLALETLPLNSLVVIAAELVRNLDKIDIPSDMGEAADDALDSLYIDVLNAGCSRAGDDVDFTRAVNWWYQEPGADSRKWYQRILGALEKQ